MHAAIDRLLFSPPAFVEEPETLLRPYLHFQRPDGTPHESRTISYPTFAELASHFGDAELSVYAQLAVVLGNGPTARTVNAALVSGNFFSSTGIDPSIGRTLMEFDTQAGSPYVAAASERLLREISDDESAGLGKVVLVDGRAVEIVGVMPQGIDVGDSVSIDVWLPLEPFASLFAGDRWQVDANRLWLKPLLRLSGTENEAAIQRRLDEVANTLPSLQALGPASLPLGPIQARRSPSGTDIAHVGAWLLIASVMVLALAATNASILTSIRMSERGPELATRRALGMDSFAALVEVSTEGILLVFVGSVLGYLVGPPLARLALSVLASQHEATALVVSTSSIAITLLASTATLAVVLATQLRAGLSATRLASVSTIRARASTTPYRAFLFAEVLMTCVLLAGAALFVKSILTIRASPLGIETSDVTAIIADTRSSSYLDDEIDAQFERAATALRSLPGVTSSSASLTVPLHSAMGVATFSDGSNAPVVNASGVPYLNAVTQDYFRTVGTRLVRGRTFADIDAAGAPRVAIVNESLGSLIADGNDALGRCLYLGDRSEPCTRIVGIVEDTKRFSILPESPALQIYLPLEQNDFDNMRPSVLLIRAAGSDDLLATPRELERMVRTYAPSAGHVTVRRLDDIVDSQLRPWRLGTNMLMLFGAIALLLGFIGVFAVAWYSTVQRRREIALRVALGASNRDVTRAINAGILAMAGMALLVGTVVSVLGQRYLSSVMYGFDRFSWGAHALVAIGLLIWCLVAGLWPTWRALRIDPAAILKE